MIIISKGIRTSVASSTYMASSKGVSFLKLSVDLVFTWLRNV